MLIPFLFAASLFAHTRTSASSRNFSPVSAATAPLHFLVSVPPPAGSSRQMAPLTATLRLDSEAEERREEKDLISAINGERTTRGLGPLVLDPLLTEAARVHSHEMCQLSYFNHRSPDADDHTPMDRYLAQLADAGLSCPAQVMLGENIFYSSETSDFYNAAFAHQSLMASPDHRENILEPRFTKVGVGLYRDPQGRFWVTEMFLRDS